jgi:hypothetical protein
MKKLLFIFAFISLASHGQIEAATVGVGAVIGSPTGFSVNLFTQAEQSVHTIAAWDTGDDEEEFLLASHYTWRRHDFSNKNAGWFYGVGGRLQLLDENDHAHNPDQDEFEIGPSATVGLLYTFNPIEVFVKGNGTVNIIEDTDFEGDLMLGAHYNF